MPDWMRERLRFRPSRHPSSGRHHQLRAARASQPMHAFDCASSAAASACAAPGRRIWRAQRADLHVHERRLLIADAAGRAGRRHGRYRPACRPGRPRSSSAPASVRSASPPPAGARAWRGCVVPFRARRRSRPAAARAERASQLVLEICGGKAGPVTETGARSRSVHGQAAPRAARPAARPRLCRPSERLLKRLGIGVLAPPAGRQHSLASLRPAPR